MNLVDAQMQPKKQGRRAKKKLPASTENQIMAQETRDVLVANSAGDLVATEQIASHLNSPDLIEQEAGSKWINWADQMDSEIMETID